MKKVIIRFYAELNDFLPVAKKPRDIEYCFNGMINSRETIESLGVPHSAVDLILINGQFNPFTRCLVCNGKLGDAQEHDVKNLIKPELLNLHKAFFSCRDCGRVYWEGSHYNGMLGKINKLSGNS